MPWASITKWVSVPRSITAHQFGQLSRGVDTAEEHLQWQQHHHQQTPNWAMRTREGAQEDPQRGGGKKQDTSTARCKTAQRAGSGTPSSRAPRSIRKAKPALSTTSPSDHTLLANDLERRHLHHQQDARSCPFALSDQARTVSTIWRAGYVVITFSPATRTRSW